MQQIKISIFRSNLKQKLFSSNLLKKFLSSCFITLALLINSVVAADNQKVVAITQIVEHPSLEEAKRGVLDVLSEHGYIVDQNLKIIDQCAQNSIPNAILIAKKFISINPDVIIPISTPSAQSVINSVRDTNIPVVFSSVTDPVAAGLVQYLEQPIENITGAIDSPLIYEEIKLIQELLPNIKTIGFIYNSGEANSVKTIALFKQAIAGKMKYTDSTIVSSNQLTQAIESLVGKVDAIYVPSDNTVFSAMAKLVQLSNKYKLPVFSSDPHSVKQGILACVGYTQYEVGRTAGTLVLRILEGERYIAIEKPSKAKIFINKKSADIMNINILKEIAGFKIEIVE